MHVMPLIWIVTCLVIVGLFVFDFFAHVRTQHEPTFRESAFWSAVYIGIAGGLHAGHAADLLSEPVNVCSPIGRRGLTGSQHHHDDRE